MKRLRFKGEAFPAPPPKPQSKKNLRNRWRRSEEIRAAFNKTLPADKQLLAKKGERYAWKTVFDHNSSLSKIILVTKPLKKARIF